MISSEFYEIFQNHFTSHFQGCYGSNNIPKNIKLYNFCIVNNRPIEEEGEHWLCLYRDSKVTLECFDSLGIDSSKKEFLQKTFEHSRIKQIDFNTSAVQRHDTTTCGQFTLYFLFQRMLNQDIPYNLLLDEIFTDNLNDNEARVLKFFEEVVLDK